MEIKRMYVDAGFRQLGVAKNILEALEFWRRNLGYKNAVLETGLKQPESILLYKRSGYTEIPNYEPIWILWKVFVLAKHCSRQKILTS